MKTYLHPISRALVALIFIMSGVGKLMAFGGTAQMMGGVGFPAPQFFLVCAIVFELFGGLALLVGYKTRIAAAALIVFLIPATLIFHAAHLGGPDGQMQVVQVLKNLAIMGALVKFLADGAGAFSIDNKGAEYAA